MPQYFFNELEPDNIFFLLNHKPKIMDSNDKLSYFFKEYLDFVSDVPNRRSLSFSTEELRQTNLRQINKECFSKMSKLTSRYISATNNRISEAMSLLGSIQKASINLELSKNINQIRSLSDSMFNEIHLESVESASDIIRRLDIILAVLPQLKDIKSILIDPVKRNKNVLGDVTSSIINNLKANKSFRYIDSQIKNDSIACESVFPYTRSSAVRDYMSNVSLADASYNTKSLFEIYRKLSNIYSSLENYFTKNYTDISSYNQSGSYFEKTIKSLKESYFENDDLPLELSLPVRFTRLSSSINIITDVILPSIYKDIKYTIEIFSRLGSVESANTSSESFKIPSIQSKMDSLNDIYKHDYSYIDNNYKKFLQCIVKRAQSRIKEVNDEFKNNIPQRLYHCRPKDTLIFPMCIDEYNQRLSFYEAVFLGASKYLESVNSDLSKNKLIDDISENTLSNLTEYLTNLVKDSNSNLFISTKEFINRMSTTTSYLDTLENENKISLESMGYNQDNINNLNINGFRDSVDKYCSTLDTLILYVTDSTTSDNNLKNKQIPLLKVLTLLTSLSIQSKFEVNFLNCLCDG